jgi:putative transposase
MRTHYQQAGLSTLCGLFGKTRQAYYEHNWQAACERLQEAMVIDLAKQLRSTLKKGGGLKLLGMLKPELKAHNITMGRDRFFKLLRKQDMLQKRRKTYVRTTDSDHPYRKWPNLIAGWQPHKPQQLWVSDITYLRIKTGFVYLSLITDAYSRKIVGYHLSQYLQARGCVIALSKAISSLNGYTAHTLIHHSDRGIQYCCEQYVNVLQENKIQISMTQSGSPYDNAIAERVNGILKTELELGKTFVNYGHAVAATHTAIDLYNRVRPHMSCDNMTPQQAHLTQGTLKKRWKSKAKKLQNDLNLRP